MTATSKATDDWLPTRQSLLTRLKNWDDQEGWREFFDTYWKLIHGVARKAGLTEDEAQEVVQETVMTVAKNLSEFKKRSKQDSFKAWLLHTTRWRIADQFRKRPPAEHASIHRSPDDTARTATVERVPDPNGPQVETLWDVEWEKNRITVALERLRKRASARQFQIFQLLVTREMDPTHVAKILGVSRTLVYVTKHRLGKLFRQELEQINREMR